MGEDLKGSTETPPMNILFYTVDYKPMSGGISEHTHQLARYFDRNGDNVVTVAPSMSEADAFDGEQSFPIYRIPSYPIVKHILMFSILPYLIWKHQIDWVYCPMWFPTGIYAVIWEHLFSVKTVIAVHAHEVVYDKTTFGKRLAWHLRYIQSVFLGMASIVIAVSSYTKNRVIDIGVDEKKVHVVHNGVTPERFDTTETHSIAKQVKGPIILTVARLDPRKGHDVVLKSLPYLLDSYPSLTYVVAGDGDRQRELEALAEDIGVNDAVEFLGYVPDDELPSLYNTADVFVMPNRREGTSVEGFGIVFLEANAAGTPVVGGQNGGAVDAIEHNDTGYLVDPEDPLSVAAAIERLLDDDELRRSLGQVGKKRVEESYTWNDAGSELRSILVSTTTIDR